jgi:hypothetical protein
MLHGGAGGFTPFTRTWLTVRGCYNGVTLPNCCYSVVFGSFANIGSSMFGVIAPDARVILARAKSERLVCHSRPEINAEPPILRTCIPRQPVFQFLRVLITS